jgi:hypothetical protein
MRSTSSGLEVGAIIAVLVVGGLIAFPMVVKPRVNSQGNACIANLKQIQGAIEQYALENKLEASNRVSISDISGGTNWQTIRPMINVDLTCPGGGFYSVGTVAESPRCSVHGTAP